ncbi:hypothetical protein [Paenibacillus sp. PCH8]|uniref:hypothetical protein n=1 Tax=Paenibacillus sp. PCH8 TaxID=2066524 RepID=UPI0021582A98|nr:hypothetical protein [Paenibacillus sp. PCH8]
MSVPASAISEETVHSLPDRDDTLTVELTTALMKAVYYQQLNDATAHEYIHTSYLHFYLEKYGRPDDVDLPEPLAKALLYYKVQYYRSKLAFVDVLTHATRLSELSFSGSEFWLSVQNIKMEAYIQVRQYEEAKQAQLATSGSLPLTATATVITITDTGKLINFDPIVVLVLEVTETNGTPYQRTLETLVSKMQIPRVGDRVGLGQNPANPSELIYMGLLSG